MSADALWFVLGKSCLRKEGGRRDIKKQTSEEVKEGCQPTLAEKNESSLSQPKGWAMPSGQLLLQRCLK